MDMQLSGVFRKMDRDLLLSRLISIHGKGGGSSARGYIFSVKVNGVGLSSFLAKKPIQISELLIIDFVLMSPSGKHDFWIELDFDAAQTPIGFEDYIFASIMFADEENRFPSNSILTIEIMKYVFKVFPPVVACGLNVGELRSLIVDQAHLGGRWGGSFLIINTGLLPFAPAINSLQVHHAEYLDRETLWINPPSGLGHEYPSFVTIEMEMNGLIQKERISNPDLGKILDRSYVSHSKGMDAVLKQIDFRRMFPSSNPLSG